jgi:hypothetical protein
LLTVTPPFATPLSTVRVSVTASRTAPSAACRFVEMRTSLAPLFALTIVFRRPCWSAGIRSTMRSPSRATVDSGM